MFLIISLTIIMVIFIISMTIVTLSDTETFKAIDRKIANRIEKRRKRNENRTTK